MHARYLARSVAQELAIVVQAKKPRDIEFVHVEGRRAVDYELGGRPTDSSRSWNSDLTGKEINN